MEDEKINSEQPGISEEKTTSTTNSFSFSGFRESPMKIAMLLLAAIIIFGLIAGGILLASNNGSLPGPDNEEEVAQFEAIGPYSFIYGYWVGDATKINSANLQNGNIYEVASLSYNIKKISVISQNSLLFINKTDMMDHGQEIALYDTKTDGITVVTTASEGFGIDDYQLSPNKRYLAIWEVSIPDGAILAQGLSRVYTVDLENLGAKNLIYDENLSQTTYAHYPIGVSNIGEVFYDTFRPNSGIGWANGMSYSNLDGSVREDLPQVARNSYGTQPRMSHDGTKIIFAGYDGARGAGDEDVQGYRRSVVFMNSIDTLDTTTKVRTKLSGLSSENIYGNVEWGMSGGDILYTVSSSNTDQDGQYIYSLDSGFGRKLTPPEKNNEEYFVISTLSPGKYLAAQYDGSEDSLANLGSYYSDSISELISYDSTTNEIRQISLNNPFVQSIGLFDANYFTNSDAVGGIGQDALSSQRQLQIETFVLKPTLAPVRKMQQTDNPDPVATPTPRPIYGTNCPRQESGFCYSPKIIECDALGVAPADCCPRKHPVGDRACHGSPLYLYGDEGKDVSVRINTQIHNPNIPYEGGIYSGILTGDGGININGINYENIDFDYNSAIRKLPRLDYGKTVSVANLNSTLHEFGEKLGLTKKEVADTMQKIMRENINSKYVFVSFYDDKVSKAILPISFNPMPDVYRNVVFYLKPTDKPIVARTPEFETFMRRGFTAVEVSYILDR